MLLDLTTTTLVVVTMAIRHDSNLSLHVRTPDLGVSLDARYHGNHVGKNG